MDGEGREEGVQRDANRVGEVVIRIAQTRREPGKADRGHEHAGPVARPTPPGEEPSPDERPADEQPEHRREAAVVRVVARGYDCEVGEPGGKPRQREAEDGASRRGRASVRQTAPAAVAIAW